MAPIFVAPLCTHLRVADMAEIKDIQPDEKALQFDLADMEPTTIRATEGVDAIVHFGDVPLERSGDSILNGNIRGSDHIYEGARKNGVARVVYSNSVHAIGYHGIEDQIDASAPHRPDGLYGLSKCFVEDRGRLYWDKFGLETAALRILSSFPEPAETVVLACDMAALGWCIWADGAPVQGSSGRAPPQPSGAQS